MPTLFADIILPIPLAEAYTYRVPQHLEAGLCVGCRVVVQFGKKRVLTGIVWRLHEQPPAEYEARPLLDVLETEPSVTAKQFELFKWMAAYYLCSLGEVTFAALPSGLKLSSESRIQLNPDAEFNPEELTAAEHAVVYALRENETLNFEEVGALPEVEHLTYTLRKLMARKIIITYEQVRERYTPRRIKVLRLADAYAAHPEEMELLIARLKRAPRKIEALAQFITLVPLHASQGVWVEKSKMLANNVSSAAIKSLANEGIFFEEERTVSRLGEDDARYSMRDTREDGEGNEDSRIAHCASRIALSDTQSTAARAISTCFEKQDIVLLHGVTGSGKTEVYIHQIAQVIAQGQQALFMVPEIALTTQMVSRLRQVFGSKMGVYHSRFSDNERVEVWKGLQEGRFQVIIGVRSSIMLPFDNLGLIVVDEEHEPTYKQQEPAPRYHGRDVALVAARHHHAKVLLGSATPSIESYWMAAIQKKWGLVEMHERFGHIQMPLIQLIDIRTERKRRTMQGDFSAALLTLLQQTVEAGQQAILFQNRRGYSPYVSCRECGWIPRCENCDVSLTYHQHARQLRCHYCGYTESLPSACRACGSPAVKTVGFGTEKLEEETTLRVPGAKVLRMDQDTTRRKNAFHDIISEFEQGKANIMVGTQMVTKGLDFDNVQVVGIFDIDRLMHFPDYRAHERVFQTVTQVAGRAGRKYEGGLVLIQTANPENALFEPILAYDYKRFFDQELAEREKYYYPPFTRLIKIILKHEDKAFLQEPAQWLATRLRLSLGEDAVLGPEPPLVEKIRNLYLMDIHIKLPREGTAFAHVKNVIADSIRALPKYKGSSEFRVVVDVDPA